MKLLNYILSVLFSIHFSFYLELAVAQQIYDVYGTVWDRSELFTYTNLNPPINFVSPSTPGAADIVIDDSQVFQTVEGFGATLTDSAASTLASLKAQNPTNYWNLLKELFDATDSNHNAGFTYLRIPLGATDFSPDSYTFDEFLDDNAIAHFNTSVRPQDVIAVVNDIQTINNQIKFHGVPWSPPSWMKDSGSINGGNMLDAYLSVLPNYLYKCVQDLASHQINLYAISIQNEPQNNNPTYPTAVFTYSQLATVAGALVSYLSDGFSNIKILTNEHNWSMVESYAIPSIQDTNSASIFSGASFHCYDGDVSQQTTFHNAYPDMIIAFTECTGTLGSDFWSDIKWNMQNLMIGSIENWSSFVGLWNLALNPQGGPELPGSNSCNSGDPGCRGVVTINSDGTYVYNQEFYVLAQASKAILPKDAGGPFGQRIGSSVQGSLAGELVVSSFVTGRTSSSDWLRYSLVVLNWNDGGSSGWNPQNIEATIEFRGMQATFDFPVGVTTIFWYAPSQGISKRHIKIHNDRNLRTNRFHG